MTRRANHTITQSVPTPLHPPVVSPSHLRDRLVDKHVANPHHHPLQRQEVRAERVAPIVELETVPDHVQLLVTCDPQFGIHRLVKQIKGRSSWLLRQEFPSLKSKLPTLWTNSYFVANSGWGDIGGRQPLRREPTQCLTDALTPHG